MRDFSNEPNFWPGVSEQAGSRGVIGRGIEENFGVLTNNVCTIFKVMAYLVERR